jgi:parallel beta-helix repeat protein
VRNCIISGFLNNVRVSREGVKTLSLGSEYDAPFSDIVIENSRLYASRGSGVFVNAYVTGVTLRGLDIANSGSVGVYLEAGSKDNVVERDTIHNNGFGAVDPVNGVPYDLGGGVQVRVLQTGREGIAIDGSRNNRVADNVIYSNAAGGIFLYKNCGEYATQKPNQWWQRNYGADGNVLEGDTIVNEPEGTSVGSRMAEDQYFMDCSDPAYATGPLHRLHLDHAKNKVLRNNTLVRVDNAVRVEDDGTTVANNTIRNDDPVARGVLVGTKWRTQLLGRPVDNTSISANTVTIPDATAAYGWVHGQTNTTFGPNVANGAPAPFNAGTQPKINPWLFVVRVWAP